MENKSTKIFTAILGVLFVVFVAAAAYTLIFEAKQSSAPASRVQTKDTLKPSSPAPQQQVPDMTHIPQTQDTAAMQDPDSSSDSESSSFTHNTKQVPRQLTEEQKEENRRELSKMAEELPDNMWVPKEPAVGGYNPEQGEKLRKSIELSDKIKKGSASAQEQTEYYTYKLKETRDKIELIQYIARRTQELAGETGKAYLTQSDVDTGEQRIEELELLAGEYEQKLSEIQTENAE